MAITDQYADDEHPSYFHVYSDYGLFVSESIADAWTRGSEAAKQAPKAEKRAVRRSALAATVNSSEAPATNPPAHHDAL